MTRAEKAQRLVDEGAVELAHTEDNVTSALVSSKGARYQVFLFVNGHFFCDCFWGRLHSYTDDLCAHALAVQLVVSRDDEAERAQTETLLNALDETWGA